MVDTVEDIGRRHGFSADAAQAAARAIQRGGGRMAQFSHPELGGLGQWSAGGMIMIGDMFNHALRARVQALCHALADTAASPPPTGSEAALNRLPEATTMDWWPPELGRPSATGAQNGMRYACFPDQRRLAVAQDGQTRTYDTGDHRIHGFSQQQSGGQTLTFTSQNGTVRLNDLKMI